MTANDGEQLSNRTFDNEDRLPRVPLPTLEDSCARFIEWCAPLLTVDELAATESAVASFLKADSPARTLQAALQEYGATPGVHSWLDEFWRSRYLGRRDRIALNANFFFLFQPTGEGQLERAVGLIAGAVGYKLKIDDERVAPRLQRGRPLSMLQDKYLFSSTRIPGTVIDSSRNPYSDDWPGPSQERHIVVFRRGHMFRLDVIGPSGRLHTLDELASGLSAIMAAGAVPDEPGTSVGHLTTKARAEWAASRQALRDLGPANADALDVIERALFCLCLDDLDPKDDLAASDGLLHGDSGNRWYDKALSLIVFADGTAGLNGEHCNLDGTTMVDLTDALLAASSAEHAEQAGAAAQGDPVWAPITFVLDDALRADVQAAAKSFADYAANTASATLAIEGFTATRAKQLKTSPDAFAQMAFQLAHKRAKGHVGATYESISTRTFHHGRTEAMRVVTPEVVRFVETMDNPDADAATRRAVFRAATDKHVTRVRECQAGDAPEQHLWALQMIQLRRGAQLGVTEPLDLYQTPGWLIMRDDCLSTSATSSPNVQFFGFGSTSAKCIGVGYVLMPDRFNIYLSTPRAVSEQMYVFADKLREAIVELEDLLAEETAA
ncbi:MAG: choline/carnitine O-acyltransferase [Pseudonocardia sp.]|nr:choline/carnitine O-acyltransferase [Pseudonocardia sp.]